MSPQSSLSQILAGLLYISCPCQSFADTETVAQHRAIIDEREPDLPNKTAAVMRSAPTPGTLTIRCYPAKGLIAEVDYGRLGMYADLNAGIRMTYQADNGSVSEDKAWHTGPGRAIVPNSRQILEDALNASALYVQFEMADRPTIKMVFRPNDVSSTLRKIQSDCPTDAPPPDQTGLAK